MKKVSLGIDIAKDKFDVAVFIKDKWKTGEFVNSKQHFKKFYQWLDKYELKEVHICMESTGIYGIDLATDLFEKGFSVSIVNPTRIKRYGQCELSRTKTDQSDAKLIARFCQKMEPNLWSPKPLQVQTLREWVEHINRLKNTKVREENRLKVISSREVKEEIKKHIETLKTSLKTGAPRGAVFFYWQLKVLPRKC